MDAGDAAPAPGRAGARRSARPRAAPDSLTSTPEDTAAKCRSSSVWAGHRRREAPGRSPDRERIGGVAAGVAAGCVGPQEGAAEAAAAAAAVDQKRRECPSSIPRIAS
ncbi:hypothetical protein ACFSM7_10315 [Clavibacter michiganensis subsp. tessellarius]|uniref:hypothetical protein n=1 Tax=Clavibacter tessellarius TaxID=31965 RepID=UPI0036255FEC